MTGEPDSEPSSEPRPAVPLLRVRREAIALLGPEFESALLQRRRTRGQLTVPEVWSTTSAEVAETPRQITEDWFGNCSPSAKNPGPRSTVGRGAADRDGRSG